MPSNFVLKRTLSDHLLREAGSALKRAESEVCSSEINVEAFYEFSIELGRYFEAMALLQQFCPDTFKKEFGRLNARKRKVINQSAPLFWGIRRGLIRDKIYNIEASNWFVLDKPEEANTLEDLEREYHQIKEGEEKWRREQEET